jgi:hypothetical protein
MFNNNFNLKIKEKDENVLKPKVSTPFQKIVRKKKNILKVKIVTA